jgi:hypothetical protein
MTVLLKTKATKIGIDGDIGSHFCLTICRGLLLFVLEHLGLATQSHLRKEMLAVKCLDYQ